VTVMFSHKNLDNIAKYHIMNWSSNLYFNGTLPKDPDHKNQFQYSDFKSDLTVRLDETSENVWTSREVGKDGNPILQFNLEDVESFGEGETPPYSVKVIRDGEEELWFLEQPRLVPSGQRKQFTKGQKEVEDPNLGIVNHHDNTVSYDIPTKGEFKWAHRQIPVPHKYLDYLYVANAGLAFKVSEESHSFADAMSKIPPFYIDEVLRNKLMDLNNVQILSEYSTFIHQSEEPRKVRDCGSFNPLIVDAVLRYGIEQREATRIMRDNEGNPAFDENDKVVQIDDNGDVVEYNEDGESKNPLALKMVCTEGWKNNWGSGTPHPQECDCKLIELSNHTNATRLELQLEDGEVDDHLKIYANYVRVDDGCGDFHYDLYFNMQNLFNSPFEYISSVTGQPNVLIIPDSYLYLTGDKFKKGWDNQTQTHYNEIDPKKVDAIKAGGELSIYGQVKTYSDDVLC